LSQELRQRGEECRSIRRRQRSRAAAAVSMVSLSGMGPLLGDADSEQGIAMIL
jgi:hypothetical protein